MTSADVRSAESQHPNRVLAVLMLACASFALAQTLVVPAVPGIAAHVGTSTATASWVLTGFLLSASVATPIVGKLGDLHGKGRVLAIVLLIFSLAGVVNAFADSIGVLIAGRLAQGVAGGVFPLAYGIIRDTFPRARVPGALGLVSAVFGIGGGIGLPLSGLILDHLNISWIFWLNVLALPAAAAAYRVIPASPPVPKSRIDWVGAVLLSAALTFVLLGVTQAGGWGWGSPRTVGLIGLGLLVFALWMWVETRVTAPLIHMGVLRRPAVAATNLVGLMVGFAMFGSFLAIPQFAQAAGRAGYGFGFTVTAAGFLLVPVAAAELLAGTYAGRLEARFGSRTVLGAGALLLTATFTTMAFAHEHPWQFVAAGVLFGNGLTLCLASMANVMVNSVAQSEVGIATGINTVTRTVGVRSARRSLPRCCTHVLPGTEVPSEGAYTAVFACSAAASVLAFAATLLVPRTSRRAQTGPEPAAEPAHT